jgi:hypothetical protein
LLREDIIKNKQNQGVLVKRSFVLLVIAAVALGMYVYLKNQSAPTAIAEIERVRGSIAVLLEEREVRNGEVVFYMEQNGQGVAVINADYIKKSFLGWKRLAGGGHTLPSTAGADEQSKAQAIWSYQYMSALKGTMSGDSPFPLLFGTVQDARITSVTVKNIKSGEEAKAEMVSAKNGIKLWYAFVPWEQGKFELTGFSGSGQAVTVKHVF